MQLCTVNRKNIIMDILQINEQLKKFDLFNKIAENQEKLSKVSAMLDHRKIDAGKYIFKQGDEGQEFFILVSGSVRVLKSTKQKEEYTIIDLQSEGNVFFGEIALLDNDLRSVSIKTLEDCEVLVLSQERFTELGDEHPHIALLIMRAIAKGVCGNLRDLNKDVVLLFDSLVNEIETTQL